MAYGTADVHLAFGKINIASRLGQVLLQLQVQSTRYHFSLAPEYPGTKFTLTCPQRQRQQQPHPKK